MNVRIKETGFCEQITDAVLEGNRKQPLATLEELEVPCSYTRHRMLPW